MAATGSFLWIFTLRQGAFFFIIWLLLSSFVDMRKGMRGLGIHCERAEPDTFDPSLHPDKDELELETEEQEKARMRRIVQAQQLAADHVEYTLVSQMMCSAIMSADGIKDDKDSKEKVSPVTIELCQIRALLRWWIGIATFYVYAFAFVCASAPKPNVKYMKAFIVVALASVAIETPSVFADYQVAFGGGGKDVPVSLAKPCCYEWKDGQCFDPRHNPAVQRSFVDQYGDLILNSIQLFISVWMVYIMWSFMRVCNAGGTGDEMVSNELILSLCEESTPDRLIALTFLGKFSLRKGKIVLSVLIFSTAMVNAVIAVLRLSNEDMCLQWDPLDILGDKQDWDHWCVGYSASVLTESLLSFGSCGITGYWYWKFGDDRQVKRSKASKIFKALLVAEMMFTLCLQMASFWISAAFFPAYQRSLLWVDNFLYFWRIVMIIWLIWIDWSQHQIRSVGCTGNEDFDDILEALRAPLRKAIQESDEDYGLESEGDSESGGSFLDDLLGGGSGSGSDQKSERKSVRKFERKSEKKTQRKSEQEETSLVDDFLASDSSGSDTQARKSQKELTKNEKRSSFAKKPSQGERKSSSVDDLLASGSSESDTAARISQQK